jgi:plastocyanin
MVRMKTQRVLFLVLLFGLCLKMASGAQGGGTVGGKVTVEGVTVMAKTINMASEPGCAKMYSTPPKSEDLVVGQGSALENVVVYISAGAPEESAPTQPVQVVQKGCRFAPHVVVMQTGQPVQMINEDSTSHNIHPLATNNREWNKAEPPGTTPLTESFARPEFISVKCNVHPWMHAYFAVVKTSHYAVTGDNGAFSLNNLPPGKYTITAWHETLGSQTQEITITGNETVPVNFAFKR